MGLLLVLLMAIEGGICAVFSPRYSLLLPACLLCLLGFVFLKKSIDDDSKPRIVMVLSGWLICSVGFGIIMFRVILNQI